MLILCNYDACYHSLMNFLHWYVIFTKVHIVKLFRANYVCSLMFNLFQG